MIEVNLNDFVYVQLTDFGLKTYAEFYKNEKFWMDKLERDVREINGKNYYEFQLWNLSEIFGKEMYQGNENVVEMDVFISPVVEHIEPQLKDEIPTIKNIFEKVKKKDSGYLQLLAEAKEKVNKLLINKRIKFYHNDEEKIGTLIKVVIEDFKIKIQIYSGMIYVLSLEELNENLISIIKE